MKKIEFTKMAASGNDFVVLEFATSRVRDLNRLAKKLCERKNGIGADGLLLIEKSEKADLKMRIFNPDGNEVQMCGNGARCVAFWSKLKSLKIETKAGIIEANVNKTKVKIKLTDPKGIKLDFPIEINNRPLRVNFINTGVPHVVVFVEGLRKIDVVNIGRELRYHKRFLPAGTNADFFEIFKDNYIGVRTYERGVENETLACGTGAAASAIVHKLKQNKKGNFAVDVLTKGKEKLKVYFKIEGKKINNVFLEGSVKIIHRGRLDYV